MHPPLSRSFLLASFEAVTFIGGIVALLVGIFAIAGYFHRKRQKALAETAASLGLDFDPKPGEAFLEDFSRLPLSQQGRSNRVSGGVIEGALGGAGSSGGVSVRVFDHSYTTGSGKSSSTHFSTVVALQVEGLSLPVFVLKEEGIHFSFFGLFKRPEDINFDGWPLFSDKFHLTGEDEAAVRRLFNPRVLEFCEQRIGMRVECAGDALIVYRLGKRIKPALIPDAVQESGELAALLIASQV